MDTDHSVPQPQAPTPPGRAYTAPGVTVYFDAARCLHFAECVRGLPNVFDTAARPWIQPANAEAPDVAEVIRRCPSGALHYVLDSGPPEQGEAVTTVTPLPGGPLLLTGTLHITTAGENGPGILNETRMAACRCGKTANSPFCDGSCDIHGEHKSE
ncbi:hypothetical protein GFY24_29375 [Nocardia sp. SYP-A9097]|uniref:(4Fe-4S)-binding protein n=1 Tax=Nocardia sp. SYP-A9097 TaxID=2663237 RepID=UPI00129A2F70|nr:(4Fe-4S)-binding protein [Nocardia sp. SYP-A9097]MRH91504.1 hypothetical protein [Nocardia sp. SYP-A9097]